MLVLSDCDMVCAPKLITFCFCSTVDFDNIKVFLTNKCTIY
jgi:hypothetical protein